MFAVLRGLPNFRERAQLEPEEEEEMLQGFESSDNDGSSDEGSSDEESQPGLLAKDLPNLAGEAPVASKLSKAKQHKSVSAASLGYIARHLPVELTKPSLYRNPSPASSSLGVCHGASRRINSSSTLNNSAQSTG